MPTLKRKIKYQYLQHVPAKVLGYKEQMVEESNVLYMEVLHSGNVQSLVPVFKKNLQPGAQTSYMLERWFSVRYTLYFKGKDFELVDIRNEYNFSVEKNSEVWDHFQEMFKQEKEVA
jgi:hypothetical protein